MQKKRIIICGGHLSPALAIIEKIRENNDFDVFYIGRINPLEGDKSLSLEYQTINNLHIEFRNFNGARLQRKLSFYTLPALFKFPLSMFHACQILEDIKPSIRK